MVKHAAPICKNCTYDPGQPAQCRRSAGALGSRPIGPYVTAAEELGHQPHHHLAPHRGPGTVHRWPTARPGWRRLGANRPRARGAFRRRAVESAVRSLAADSQASERSKAGPDVGDGRLQRVHRPPAAAAVPEAPPKVAVEIAPRRDARPSSDRASTSGGGRRAQVHRRGGHPARRLPVGSVRFGGYTAVETLAGSAIARASRLDWPRFPSVARKTSSCIVEARSQSLGHRAMSSRAGCLRSRGNPPNRYRPNR